MTSQASGEKTVSMRERLVVHRVVEQVRGHLFTCDSHEAMATARQVVQASERVRQLSRAGRALLDEEVVRIVARFEKEHADVDWALYGQVHGDEFVVHEPDGPVDPYGELAGGRVGTACLLGRRCDESTLDDHEVVGERVGEGAGGDRWGAGAYVGRQGG